MVPLMSSLPPWHAPFIIETAGSEPDRREDWDLHLPSLPRSGAAEREPGFPLAVLVHGGPLPVDCPEDPRDWPVFRGYAGLLKERGTATAVVRHPLHSLEDFPGAFGVVRDAVEAARSLPDVDSSRVAVWHFSGGGPMVARWMSAPPPWLRCLAMTYPILDDRPDRVLPPGFRPIEAVPDLALASPRPAVVLVRVGREAPSVAAGVERFVSAAQRSDITLDIVAIPDGVHGFDYEQPSDQARRAVVESIDRVIQSLR